MERSLTLYCQQRFASIFKSRYLTLLAGYLLPHNFIFKSPSNFFYLKIIISPVFTVSEILFAIHQLTLSQH